MQSLRRLRDHLGAHYAEEKAEDRRKEKGPPEVEENGAPSGPGRSLPALHVGKTDNEHHC